MKPTKEQGAMLARAGAAAQRVDAAAFATPGAYWSAVAEAVLESIAARARGEARPFEAARRLGDAIEAMAVSMCTGDGGRHEPADCPALPVRRREAARALAALPAGVYVSDGRGRVVLEVSDAAG